MSEIEFVNVTKRFGDTVAVESEAGNVGAAQRPHEDIARPRRKPVAGIERHAGRGDRRIPVVDRLFHPLLRRAGADHAAQGLDGPVAAED